MFNSKPFCAFALLALLFLGLALPGNAQTATSTEPESAVEAQTMTAGQRKNATLWPMPMPTRSNLIAPNAVVTTTLALGHSGEGQNFAAHALVGPGSSNFAQIFFGPVGSNRQDSNAFNYRRNIQQWVVGSRVFIRSITEIGELAAQTGDEVGSFPKLVSYRRVRTYLCDGNSGCKRICDPTDELRFDYLGVSDRNPGQNHGTRVKVHIVNNRVYINDQDKGDIHYVLKLNVGTEVRFDDEMHESRGRLWSAGIRFYNDGTTQLNPTKADWSIDMLFIASPITQ